MAVETPPALPVAATDCIEFPIMKLVLIIPALTAGGAERVMSILANYWANKAWEITLLTLDDGTSPPFFPLDSRIRHRPLALMADSTNPLMGLYNNLRRIRVLHQALRQEAPTVLISFLDSTNVLTLLASRGLKLPVIVAEHIDPAQYRIKPVWVALRYGVYPWAARVVVLTERALNYFPQTLHARCRVLPNPVVVAPVRDDPEPEPRTKRHLLAMGRLVEQKGFDILLDAFAQLHTEYPDWTLTILGEGPERVALEARADRLGIAHQVNWPGIVQHPESYLQHADLFALPSRYEGFPMALCEAMAAGLAVVAADCPTGPREIIRNGVDGLLVQPEDPTALATSLKTLMDAPDERQRMGNAARAIVERFGVEQVLGLWENLLADVIKPAR